MHNRAGDKRTSLREWMEILETSEDEYVRNVAWKHVRELKIAVDLNDLTQALSVYHERHGVWPRHLGTLRTDGVVSALPLDPEGKSYLYDRGSGRVSHQGTQVVGG